MSNVDYKKAYERQRKAREKAEELLEDRARELYEANQFLKSAYEGLQEQKAYLIQKEKLASIGLLAAGVAHELNSPIGFIKSNLCVLNEYLSLIDNLSVNFQAVSNRVTEEPDSVDYRHELQYLVGLAEANNLTFVIKDSLDSINESLLGTERVESIILGLTDFARTGDEQGSVCDINICLDSALKLVWNKIKYNLAIEKDYGDLPEVYAYSGQLVQVFVNIIINASQAISGNGWLKIGTRVVGKNVQIEFVDSGPGVPEKNLTKLFDPFFTTKDVQQGTGLGLYISHGLIQNHGGTINVSNEPNGGARFQLLIPVSSSRKHQSLAPTEGSD